ncbi:unnamed protein product, partial [marine sediment metagenome]
RLFLPGDGIEGYAELLKQRGSGKGFNYFNERVEKLMRDFNQAYLSHKNTYTRLAYKDDPAVVGLLITNENDITHHFGNRMLPDKGNPHHSKQFMDRARAFSQRTGLPQDKTWRAWEPGPSKIFLNDQEHQFNTRMLAHLKSLGVRVPVATTNTWGLMPLCGLPALTDGGWIDCHSYGKAEALSANPRYQANFISWIGAAQVYGRPLAITEWNVPYPAADRSMAATYLMAIASLQGWDAPMLYGYAQNRLSYPRRASQWSTYADPA